MNCSRSKACRTALAAAVLGYAMLVGGAELAHADAVEDPGLAPVNYLLNVGAPANASIASTTSTVTEVAQAGANVRELGEKVFPEVYASVTVDETASRMTLLVTSLGGAATDALVEAAGTVPVATVLVPRSHADLMRLGQRVIDDAVNWTDQGVVITDLGPDPVSDRLMIGVQTLSEVTAAAMQLRYGGDRVLVYQADPGEESASRTADSAPFNGGDKVTNSLGGAVCTAGFGVHLDSSPTKATGPYLVTAGHCWGNNVAVHHNGRKIGTNYRSTNVHKDYGHDISMIGVGANNSSKYIWETNTARARSDGGVLLPATGSTICHSGAATDKKCGTLKYTNHCYLNNANNLHYCAQDQVTSSTLLVAGGDSGGPWFDAYTYNSVRYESAVGIQSLGFGQYSCSTQLGSAQACYKTASYTQAEPAIADDYSMWPNY